MLDEFDSWLYTWRDPIKFLYKYNPKLCTLYWDFAQKSKQWPFAQHLPDSLFTHANLARRISFFSKKWFWQMLWHFGQVSCHGIWQVWWVWANLADFNVYNDLVLPDFLNLPNLPKLNQICASVASHNFKNSILANSSICKNWENLLSVWREAMV